MEKKFIVPEHVIEKLKELNLFESLIEIKSKNFIDSNGLRQGYWEDYYSNGQIYSKGYYVNGLREGVWEYYFLNGVLWYVETCVNNYRQGYWEEYYRDGGLMNKGVFIMDEKKGYWEYYKENGEFDKLVIH